MRSVDHRTWPERSAKTKDQPDVSVHIKDGDEVTSEKEEKVETQSPPIESDDEDIESGIDKKDSKAFALYQCVRAAWIIAVVVVLLVIVITVAIVVGYAALVVALLPKTDISDELEPYEKTIDGVKGWDINAIGGYPVLMDGFNPTWVNRTVRESGVLSDLTWRFDNTCSDGMKEAMKQRGTSVADAKPRPVPCEGNSSKRCVRLPFHFHFHGSYAENRYYGNGSSLTYRGLFHQDIFANPVSILATKNPVFVHAVKAHVDVTQGKPRKLNFPPPPELPEKAKKLEKVAGTCVDPNRILPKWYVNDRSYKFRKGMKRPFNMMLQAVISETPDAVIESGIDMTHLDEMLDAMTTRNAAGLDSAQKAWDRHDKGATHVPSASALAFPSCLHVNGDHPETRTHPQRCVNLNQKEVAVAEEVGKVGHKEWKVKNKQAYEQACAAKNDKDDCVKKDVREWGHPCGYAIVPLEQELLTFSGNTQFDPEAPEGRLMEITVGRTILKFEDSQLVVFTENLQFFALNEKPSPDGPPAYLGSLEVAPVTWGGPAPNSSDGRGKVPGLATVSYDYTRSKSRMRTLHTMYLNLYKGKSFFFGGCGMPDNDFLWSDNMQCDDSDETKKTYNTLREVVMARYSSAIHRKSKITDRSSSAYAFVQTLGCSADFLKSRRARSHGVDWLEQAVWLHQLAEYSLDIDLDKLVRWKHWNDLKPVNGTCARL